MTSWEPSDPHREAWAPQTRAWPQPSAAYDPEALSGPTVAQPTGVPNQQGPTPPAPGPSGSRRPLLIALVLLGVLVIAGGVTMGIVLGTGSDEDRPVAARPSTVTTAPVAADTAGTAATDTGGASPATVGGGSTSAAPVAPTVVAVPTGQDYSLAGVMHLTGPAGWHVDTTAGIPNIADYVAPGSTARLQGATFRFGIGNVNPAATLETEAQVSAQFLQSKYGAQILGITYTTFLGTTAVDIEYTNFNTDYGVARHGVERLWFGAGVTYIVQSSDVATDWAQASAVFTQLTSAVVLG